jgi:hypothetical protein
MYAYWRISEELKYLGEVLVFHDPSLKRCYEEWISKKAESLTMLYADTERRSFFFHRPEKGYHSMN